jgi:hypothetical protein
MDHSGGIGNTLNTVGALAKFFLKYWKIFSLFHKVLPYLISKYGHFWNHCKDIGNIWHCDFYMPVEMLSANVGNEHYGFVKIDELVWFQQTESLLRIMLKPHQIWPWFSKKSMYTNSCPISSIFFHLICNFKCYKIKENSSRSDKNLLMSFRSECIASRTGLWQTGSNSQISDRTW